MGGQTCTMLLTSATVSTATCDGTTVAEPTAQAVPDASASMTAMNLFAPMVRIIWQSSDQPQATGNATWTDWPQSVLPTQRITVTAIVTDPRPLASRPTTANGTGGHAVDAFGDPASPAAATDDGDQAQPKPGDDTTLPVGARVGLGIAGGVAGLALMVSVVVLVWRRRRRRRSRREEEADMDRLYGLQRQSSAVGSHEADGIPGWYRRAYQTHSWSFLYEGNVKYRSPE